MEELNDKKIEQSIDSDKKEIEQPIDLDNKEEIPKIVIEKSPSSEESSKEELIEAQKKVSELEERVKLLQDLLLRKAAEFENYKRRSENDQVNLIKYAAEPFIKSILIIYDDLERSLNHINGENSLDSLKKGLELVYEKFTKILESQGVKKIDAKGKQFDVDFHEALMQKPIPDIEANTVVDVIEQGYFYKDKVIRHAKVIVSSALSSEEESIKD
jgi:molecular chaperone GrpE